MPELDRGVWHGPLPTFILDRFLQPTWRHEVAIVDGSSSSLDAPAQVTYEQLYAQTYSLAAALKSELHCLKKGDIAAIMSPNHMNFFQAFHAISLTGAASTTINPQYTAEEVRYQLELTRATCIIAHPMCLKVAKEASGGEIPVFSIAPADPADPGTQSIVPFMGTSLSAIDPEAFLGGSKRSRKMFDEHSVATIPFSSGTTGRAKGVMLSHRNLTSNILQTMAYEGKYLLPEHSRSGKRGTLLCPLPFFHIYGMTAGMCVPLFVGAKLIFMSSFDLQRYLELVQKFRVSRGHVVPPIVLALAKHPLVDKYDLSSLESLMSGAAPLGGETQLLAARRLGCLVKQAWGMTETSPCGAITPDDMISSIQAIMGRSGVLAPATEGKIVDPVTGADLACTQEGELLVRGPQIMLGYFENQDATRATLRSDGFMHTGDIAKFDDEGWLYITDRSKELIKYKGFQVPPAELEALLLSMPQIKDCVVIPVLDEEAGELPRAYVVRQDSHLTLTEQQVMDFVHAKVAPYKRLRGGIRFVDSVPKSPSGKLLRRVQIQLDRVGSAKQG